MTRYCKNCGGEITIQIFKGEDWCCGICKDALVKKVGWADEITERHRRMRRRHEDDNEYESQ